MHDFLKKYFYDSQWYIPYDLLEAVLQYSSLSEDEMEKFALNCNSILERHMSGYRLVDGRITPITEREQIAMVDRVLADEQDLVKTHLNKALGFLSDRTAPDYENSVKESMSAVESKIRQVLGDDKATANRGLVEIAKRYRLHPALKEGFKKLYAYTGDADGVRHGSSKSKAIPQEEAMFFLVSCSAFISYLTAIKARENQD